jgi:hypothetical protein
MVSDILTEARLYASLGWQVLPIHTPTPDGKCSCGKASCKTPGKHPRINKWQDDATTNDQQIESWWQHWPDANIGVRLGPASNLIDIEYDNAEGEATANELFEFTSTARYRSQRSVHHLFQFPTGLNITKAVVKWRGLEIRFGTDKAGAMSVFPPSLHASGQRYTWLNHPSEFRAAMPPQWLADAIGPAVTPAVAPLASSMTGSFVMEREKPTLDNAPGETEGRRNSTLLELVGRDIAINGVTAELPIKALAWNLRNIPPLPDDEVLMAVDKLAQKELAKPPRKREQATIAASPISPTLVLPAPSTRLVVRRMEDIVAGEVRWLWPGRVPLGCITLLVGEGDAGKTFIACDLVARISRDGRYPDGEQGLAGQSLYVTAEDWLDKTLRPRLDLMGANPANVFFLELVDRAGQMDGLSLDRDLPLVEQYLAENPELRLIVIDPIMACMGDANIYKESEVRRVLTRMKLIAEKSNVAFLLIMHFTKNNDQSVAQKVSGSVAFRNAARVIWSVALDPDDIRPTLSETRRLMQRVKGNIKGVTETGLSYWLTEQGIVWSDEPIFVSANEIIGNAQSDDKKYAQAEAMLQEALRRGPVLVGDIFKLAKTKDIGRRTLERAKADMSIKSIRRGKQTWWAYPDDEKYVDKLSGQLAAPSPEEPQPPDEEDPFSSPPKQSPRGTAYIFSDDGTYTIQGGDA